MSAPLILIIDDDKLLSDTLQKVFEVRGYRAKVSYDGVKGLEMMKKENPDITLLDIMMPGKTGVQVIRDLYKEKSNLLKKTIVMTTLSDSGFLAEVLEFGVTNYIEKGETTPDGIVSLVERVISSRKQ